MSASESRRDHRCTRRRFCQAAGVSACAAAAGGAGVLSVDFLNPRALFEPPTRFVAGAPGSIGVGTVLTFEEHQAFVVRLKEGFRALSSVCTHLGCVTRYQPDQRIIACPCHGSRFSLEGEVIAGPAPQPLPTFEISISPTGEIEVNTAAVVPTGTVFRL